jgi:hypothetical protein
MKDRALWITWYDLPAEGRDAYLSWLHGSYIPMLLRKPGFLWAAHFASEKKTVHAHDYPGRFAVDVPAGNDYILLLGAGDAQAFARPIPAKLHAGLPDADRQMLAMRTGERANIFIEQARVDGPEAKRRETAMALSPCIQLGSLNARDCKDEDEMLDWYTNWRMPSMGDLPGCVGIRKLVSVAGWAKHGALYEFVSVRARNEHFLGYEKSSPEMEAWGNRLVPKLLHAPGSANVARRIFSAVN